MNPLERLRREVDNATKRRQEEAAESEKAKQEKDLLNTVLRKKKEDFMRKAHEISVFSGEVANSFHAEIGSRPMLEIVRESVYRQQLSEAAPLKPPHRNPFRAQSKQKEIPEVEYEGDFYEEIHSGGFADGEYCGHVESYYQPRSRYSLDLPKGEIISLALVGTKQEGAEDPARILHSYRMLVESNDYYHKFPYGDVYGEFQDRAKSVGGKSELTRPYNAEFTLKFEIPLIEQDSIGVEYPLTFGRWPSFSKLSIDDSYDDYETYQDRWKRALADSGRLSELQEVTVDFLKFFV